MQLRHYARCATPNSVLFKIIGSSRLKLLHQTCCVRNRPMFRNLSILNPINFIMMILSYLLIYPRPLKSVARLQLLKPLPQAIKRLYCICLFLKDFLTLVRGQRGSLTVFIRIIGQGFFIAAALLLC